MYSTFPPSRPAAAQPLLPWAGAVEEFESEVGSGEWSLCSLVHRPRLRPWVPGLHFQQVTRTSRQAGTQHFEDVTSDRPQHCLVHSPAWHPRTHPVATLETLLLVLVGGSKMSQHGPWSPEMVPTCPVAQRQQNPLQLL